MKSVILKSPLPYLALLAAYFFWGGNYVVAKLTLNEFPTFSLIFFRFAFAALFLLPFVFIEKREEKIRVEDLPKLFLAGLTMVAFNIYFSYEGLRHTSAINASVLDLSIPILSVLVGWIFLKEKIYAINLFGILLGLIGAVVVLGIPLIFFGNFSTDGLLGNLLIIISDIFFVTGLTICKKPLKRYSSLLITWTTFLVGAFVFVIPAFNDYLTNPDWMNKVTVLGGLGLTYIVLLSSISAYVLFQWALKKVEVERVTLFQYLAPGIAATFAVPFLGERISYSFIVGTIIIILGVYWGTLGKIEHHHLEHRHHNN